MLQRVLPGTDLSLSVIGMGCWPLGGEYWGPTNPVAHRAAVRAALDAGINWFDTAPLYGHGHADDVLKEALGEQIHDVILATKVGARLDGLGPAGHDGHAHSDLRPEHIVADCEASLRRLREPLDLLQIHWPCEFGSALEDSVAALEKLREDGKIRYWGVCNYGAEDVGRLRQMGRVSSLQTPYSLLRREFQSGLQQAVQATAALPAVGVLAYEALVRGLLTNKFKHGCHFGDDDQRKRDDRFQGHLFQFGRMLAADLASVGQKVNAPASAIALGWVASQPGITAVIAGCRTPEQVRANVRAAELLNRPKLWDVVHRVSAHRGRPPRPR